MRRCILGIIVAFLVSLPVAAQETQPGSLVNVVIVQPNEIGVVFNTQNGQLGEPLTAGSHVIDSQSQQVTLYPTGQQAHTLAGSEAVAARTLDSQEVSVEATFTFSLNLEMINRLHTRWGTHYVENFLVPAAHSAIRQILATFTIEQLTTNGGSNLEAQIAAALRTRLEPEGLALSNVFVRNLVLSRAVTDALEAQNDINSMWYRAQIESEIATMRAQAEMERLRLIGQQLANNPLLIFVIDGIQLATSAFDG